MTQTRAHFYNKISAHFGLGIRAHFELQKRSRLGQKFSPVLGPGWHTQSTKHCSAGFGFHVLL